MAIDAIALRVLLVLAGLSATAAAQAPQKLTVGIYVPSVEFGTAQARLVYVQGLARAIEQSTGIKTDAQSYANLAALKKDAVDFAIIDGVCYATNPGWKLLANATIGGNTTRPWALYSSAGDTMLALRGKKLSFVAAGCNDVGFVDNAMLDSEVDPGFFAERLGEKDLTAAIASVASYKTAQAVFAPVGAAKGLSKVLDAVSVPNPALVQVNGKLAAGVANRVAAAVIGNAEQGAITGWTKPAQEPYQALAARMAPVKKTGVFAAPEPARITEWKDVVLEPTTVREPAGVAVRHHFIRLPGGRME